MIQWAKGAFFKLLYDITVALCDIIDIVDPEYLEEQPGIEITLDND